MISRCERGLGWPVEDTTIVATSDQRGELVTELEEFREYTYGPGWKPHKAAFNLAMLVVSGLIKKK